MNDQDADLERHLYLINGEAPTAEELADLLATSDAETSLEGGKEATFIEELRMAVAGLPVCDEGVTVDSAFCREVVDRVRKLKLQETGNSTSETEVRPAKDQPVEFATLFEPALGPDEIGRLGNYRIFRLLGRGGMGMVFEAQDLLLERRVALKIMLPNLAINHSNRIRFIREAQAAAKVDHDNICPIYQVNDQQQTPFIAMPFLPGETLESRLNRTTMTLCDVVRIASQVAKGLGAAHAAGLIHRDIKPSNIWLEAKNDGTERVKILDFGLARFEANDSQLTLEGAILGTPAYMSPEQAQGNSVDHRTDLFSLGAVLYEMLTGRRPFQGANATSILARLLLEHPAPPHQVRASIPDQLSQWVMRLLSKSSQERPQSANEVAAYLDAYFATIASQEPIRPSHTNTGSQGSLETLLPAQQISHASRSHTRGGWSVATWLFIAMVFLLLGAGTVIALTTKNGTLVVEADDDVDIRLRKGEIQVFDEAGVLRYTLSPGEHTKSLPSGIYLVKVEGADGVQLDTSRFEMKRSGRVVLRATARASDQVPNPASVLVDQVKEIEQPTGSSIPTDLVAFAENLFSGRLVLHGSDKKFGSNLVRASEIASLKAGAPDDKDAYVLYREDALRGSPASTKLTANFSSAAFAVRFRTENAMPFVNMRIRHKDDHARWLSLIPIPNREVFQFVYQDHHRQGQKWLFRPPRLIASGDSPNWGWKNGQSIDIFGRWSENDYDLWINGKHLVGGEIAAEELFNGVAGPIEFGIIANQDGGMKLWFDELWVWDQTAVSPREASPKNLPSRPVPGIAIR